MVWTVWTIWAGAEARRTATRHALRLGPGQGVVDFGHGGGRRLGQLKNMQRPLAGKAGDASSS
jgi:hypothetical protein